MVHLFFSSSGDDSWATDCRNLVVGYVIEVALAIILVVLDNLFFMYETYVCRAGKSGKDRGFYCDTLFGPTMSDRRNEFNISYFLSLLLLNVAGGLAHVYIHKSERVKNKGWALVLANAIYLTEIVLLIFLMVFLHSGDNFWPLKLMMWYMLLVMGSIWLTGFLFVQNLVVFAVGITVYFAATFNVATSTVDLNSENVLVSELDRLLTTSLYTSTAHFILFIHLAMLTSSYMHERASRKRFFQRLMITYVHSTLSYHTTSLPLSLSLSLSMNVSGPGTVRKRRKNDQIKK